MPHCPHATRLWGSRAGTRPQSSLLGRPRSQGPGAVPGGGRGLRTPQRHPVGSPGARVGVALLWVARCGLQASGTWVASVAA